MNNRTLHFRLAGPRLAEKYRKFVLICMGLAAPLVVFGQQSITGVVLSGEDNSPLPGASVFLVNTTIGTSSDISGAFTLKDVPNGKFLLAATFVGFQSLTVEIPVEGVDAYKLILRPDTAQLADITVKARRSNKHEWLNNLNLFTKYFIGEGENASQCKLLNPEVLRFEVTKDEFKAFSSDGLVVENRALGYKVRYQLSFFRFSFSDYRITYDGYPIFEELTASSEEEKKAWEVARLETYKGSMMHFMRAFYARKLTEEGFVLRKVEEEFNLKGERKLVADVGDSTVTYPEVFGRKHAEFYTQRYKSITDTVNSTLEHPLLSFEKMLEVRYVGKKEPYIYQRARRDPNQIGYDRPQTSLLKLLKPSVWVQADGQFFNSNDIYCEGYWTWELMADALPINYQPPQSTALGVAND